MKEWKISALRSGGRTRFLQHLKSWHLLHLILLGLILGAMLMGCQVDQNALQRDPFMRDIMQLQQQQDQPHKFGQTFDVGNTRWKISAAHAALALRLGSNVVKTRGEFVLIDFSFTNMTDQPQHPTADMLLLENTSATVQYKSDAPTTALLADWQKTPNFLKDLLQPNHAYDCSLVFEIPLGAGNLSLAFQSFPTQDDSLDI